MVPNIAGVVVVEQIEEWRKRSLTNARDDLWDLPIPDGSALFTGFVGGCRHTGMDEWRDTGQAADFAEQAQCVEWRITEWYGVFELIGVNG